MSVDFGFGIFEMPAIQITSNPRLHQRIAVGDLTWTKSMEFSAKALADLGNEVGRKGE